MFVKVHTTKDYVKGNTQSCSDLAFYLDKENEGKSFAEREFFFNREHDHVLTDKVISAIDGNVKGLKKDQPKFFMLSLSPSQKELHHMARAACGRDIFSVTEMSEKELARYNESFREYVNKAMNEYARNFNRDLSRDDILYYAKIEQMRFYKGTDPDVKKGLAIAGEKKPGLQTHAHVIVSRMDKEMKKSLSPLANSRGSKKHVLNGKSVRVGFNHQNFKEYCEREFDYHYQYKREKGEHFKDFHPYFSLENYMNASMKGKAKAGITRSILFVDQTILSLNGSFQKTGKAIKDLKVATDIVKGVAVVNPAYLAAKALKRVLNIVKGAIHGLEI